ncbi:MAG: hypothetical protein IJD88_00640 [Clostridia bacterium]|nr:hypothetical protein [Clostridia bacterium]
MRKKLTIGIIMIVAGFLSKELSYIIDIGITRTLIGITATVIFWVGLFMTANAIDYFVKKKKDKNLISQTSEKEKQSKTEDDSNNT